MKILKGCLITIFSFIIICFVGYLFFKNNVLNNLAVLNKNVELSWNEYTESIKQKNIELLNHDNDSIKYYIKNSKKLKNISSFSKEFEFNEYKINQLIMLDSIDFHLQNDKINMNIENYNQSVKQYNTYRIMFPNSLIARKTKYQRDFEYIDIKYGINNENPLIKRAKIENWIKNGGDFPE